VSNGKVIVNTILRDILKSSVRKYIKIKRIYGDIDDSE